MGSSTTTQMAKIMVQYGRPCRSSWKKSVWSSIGRTVMGKAIWEDSFLVRLGENSKLGMFSVHREKGLFLSEYVDDSKKKLERNKILIRCGKCSTEKSILENQDFSLMCIFGMNSTTMQNNQRYCRQSLNHVRISNFSVWTEKLPLPQNIRIVMVLWHGWSCIEMCGAILWVSTKDDTTTLQGIYSMHRWPPVQRRRNEIDWRIVTSVLPNCSEVLILGTNWQTWHSMVSEQSCTINHKMVQGLWQTPELIHF